MPLPIEEEGKGVQGVIVSSISIGCGLIVSVGTYIMNIVSVQVL